MTKASAYNEIQILPGVMPSTDATPSDIPCWASAFHVRFDPSTGRIRKLGGWETVTFDYDATITGTIRTIYSATINNKVYTVLGTNSYLYSLIGSQLTNITPLETTPVAVANSLATHYGTLGNNPIGTTNGSAFITVTDADAARYKVNDNYTLSGASTTNGVPNTELNAEHVIRSIGSGTVTFLVATSATSTGSGGGASVVRSDGLIRVTSATHGLVDGQRVDISGAASTGGILNTEINQEFIIRNVAPNTFDVMTIGTSTSSVSGGGGAATEYYPQLAAGNLDQGLGQGYGVGLYGVGLYGTALTSTSGETYPRIWFMDRFGDDIVMTPGNQEGAYTWDGSTATAPTLIANAPTAINYLFVSDNILVTFGAGAVENKIFASDQGDYTNWTSTAANQVFEDNIEGAGRLLSHVPVDGYNLIFTEQQTYTFKYIGLPNIWQTLLLDSAIGIIAPMARISVNGIAYWMGQENFYMFRGGKIEIIPSNFTAQSSILRYVFDDLNYSQRFKIFAWYNEKFDEVWWHYQSSESNECDRIARFSRRLGCWVPDLMDRTAAEYPSQNLSSPRLANVSTLYIHESGSDDDDAAMAFSATTKKYITGKDTANQVQIVPDSTMSGTITLEVRSYNYPQSQTAMNDQSYSITGTTERVPVQLNGRYYDYTFSGEEMGQEFLMGRWFEESQKGATAP
jgi:hypothetical protein